MDDASHLALTWKRRSNAIMEHERGCEAHRHEADLYSANSGVFSQHADEGGDN